MAVKEELEFLVTRVEKVRKWLAAIAILKTAAICLLFSCIYIGGYILLDHRFNLNLPERLIALFLLIGSTGFLTFKLSRLLLVQISYTNAANFIENNYSLNQQLVAAMEYYENKADYPYSKALAEQLIIRVNKDSESFQFDSVVEKWRGFALAAFVFFGLCVVGFYVQHNLSFLKTYLARLAVPFSSVEPISATTLTAATGDIVSEPESMLVFTANIKGRIPESGQLIISPVGQDSNDQKIQLRPITDSETEPKFETSEFFTKTGQFRYRFEADLAKTQWHEIDIRETPQIKSITAEIELPQNIHDDNILKNSSEPIKNNTLEIIKNSSVTLHIESSSKLSEVEFTEPRGKTNNKELNGEKTFTYTFTANSEGNIEFNLTDDKGLKSKNIPKLKIVLKTDNPPQFKLISPDGDYLATNVSSVPIEFEITDDFGLSSAGFVAELPEGESISIDLPIKPDSNEARFSTILELEKYNLEIGDSIMFYAKATDIKTTISNEENAASSEIYFIEIRPYQEIWHIKESGGPSDIPGAVPQDLMTLLEYTRAFIKKTSVIAGKSELDSDDHSQLKSINEDVVYCSSLLIQLRDNPDNGFNDAQKAILSEILSNYDKASDYLKRYNSEEALKSEKEAYRILRKIILELEMDYNPPQGGQSIPIEEPEKVELKAAIETPEIEQEQVEEELEKVQEDIEQLKTEQNQLKDELKKVLKKQKEANEQAKANAKAQQKASNSNNNQSQQGQNGSSQNDQNQQNNSSQQSDGGSGQGSQSQQSDTSQQGQSGSGQGSESQQGDTSQQGQSGSGQGSQSQQGDTSQQSQSGSGQDSESQQSDNSQQGQSGSGQGSQSQQGDTSQQSQSGSGQGSQSQQSDTSQQSQSGSGQGSESQQSDNSQQGQSGSQNANENSSNQSQSQSIADAQLKMLQAKQANLQNEVSQLQKKLESISQNTEGNMSKVSQDVKEHLGEAVQNMEDFQKKMDELKYQPQEYDKKAKEASELMESASEKLSSADESLNNALKGSTEEQMAKELKKNAELLSENPDKLDEGLSELDRERMEALRKAAMRLLESQATAQRSRVSQGSANQGTGTHVLTEEGGASDKETAIEIARQLRFLAIELEKRKEQPIDTDPSDSRFYEAESDFFENAAKYNSGVTNK